MIKKIGLIGFGKIGKLRYDLLKKIKLAQILSVSDIKKVNIKNLNYIRNYNKIISDKEISHIFICTTNNLNNKIILAALKNNKKVFCEKPPCINRSELDKLNKLPIKYKKNLFVSFNHRTHESVIKIKKTLKKNILGKVIWVRGRYGKKIDNNLKKDWRLKKRISGGGILIDQGIHLIDLIIYLFKLKPSNIHSLLSSSFLGKKLIEDNAFLQFRDTNKKIDVSIQSTMANWRYLFSLEIFLSKGQIILNGLKTPSGSYLPEKLTIKRKNSKVFFEKNYREDNSFLIETNKFLENANSYNFKSNEKQLNRVMNIIFKAYANF